MDVALYQISILLLKLNPVTEILQYNLFLKKKHSYFLFYQSNQYPGNDNRICHNATSVMHMTIRVTYVIRNNHNKLVYKTVYNLALY